MIEDDQIARLLCLMRSQCDSRPARADEPLKWGIDSVANLGRGAAFGSGVEASSAHGFELEDTPGPNGLINRQIQEFEVRTLTSAPNFFRPKQRLVLCRTVMRCLTMVVSNKKGNCLKTSYEIR
jgi:hypothetical protein